MDIKRDICWIYLTSKKKNYKINSVYISLDRKYANEEIKSLYTNNIGDDFLIKNYDKILNLLSYEIIFNLKIKFYFDFDGFEKLFEKDFNKHPNLIIPFPYLIKIHINNTISKEHEKDYVLTLKCDEITCDKNQKIQGLYISKYSNDDFNLIEPFIYNSYELYHISEEDWKINEIEKRKKYFGF